MTATTLLGVPTLNMMQNSQYQRLQLLDDVKDLQVSHTDDIQYP